MQNGIARGIFSNEAGLGSAPIAAAAAKTDRPAAQGPSGGILCVFIGPYMTVEAVWTIADIFNGLMAIPNLIALLALNGVVVAETKKYFDSMKKQV